MTVISVIGAHDREAVTSFVGPLIIAGGVTEIRICEIGDVRAVCSLVTELRLKHDDENIVGVKMENLITKEDVNAEILVVMNSSYRNFDEFTDHARNFLSVIVSQLIQSGVENFLVVFGDNYRGLVQKNLIDILLEKNKCKAQVVTIALSSVYQISRNFNSDSDSGGGELRCYPKADGSVFTYEPSGELTQDSLDTLVLDLKSKVDSADKLFTNQSAKCYPCLEGTVLQEFVSTYIQSGYITACRDDGMYSRKPIDEEKEAYGLEHNIAIFLPHYEAGQKEVEMMPKLVKKHIKDASEFMKAQIDRLVN